MYIQPLVQTTGSQRRPLPTARSAPAAAAGAPSSSNAPIALTADVAVAQGLVVGRLVEESAIKAVLEDRTDRGDGACLDEDAASASCIDARIAIALGLALAIYAA